MLGQLNLFTFKPRVKFFKSTPVDLNRELWALIRKTDDRGYSFGTFNEYTNKKGKEVKHNKRCATVVLYKRKQIIGFCTISLTTTVVTKKTKAYLDVWVMPYYRDMGFGSILVNRANEMAIKITGGLPGGHDKNHSHCWDARFRKEPYSYDFSGRYQYPDDQLSLFTKKQMNPSKRVTVNRLLETLSRNTDLDMSMMQACVNGVSKIAESFVVPNARVR